MVTISRTVDADGAWYQIENFDNYLDILRENNIDVPAARYRVFVPSETEDDFQGPGGSVEDQICLFFRLGPAAGIPCQIVNQPAKVPSAR